MALHGSDLDLLRRLAPTDHTLTVFDADTQETSYGTLRVGGIPLIFDTHRKGSWYVSTVEILTELTRPVRIPRKKVESFRRQAERDGLQAIPYSACFFKANLHVYVYDGPLRGLDLSAVGKSVREAERRLDVRLRRLWERIPPPIARAQRDLLTGRRPARYKADLEVLRRRLNDTRRVSRADAARGR